MDVENNTGRSWFMAGLQSWKTSRRLNTKFPIKTVYFLGVTGLTTSSYIMHDNHSVSKSSFTSHFNVMKMISLQESAKPTCTCNKCNIIITLWQIPVNRTGFGLNQEHAYKHVALILILHPCTQHEIIILSMKKSKDFQNSFLLTSQCYHGVFCQHSGKTIWLYLKEKMNKEQSHTNT
jgi:hypothetical protein